MKNRFRHYIGSGEEIIEAFINVSTVSAIA